MISCDMEHEQQKRWASSYNEKRRSSYRSEADAVIANTVNAILLSVTKILRLDSILEQGNRENILAASTRTSKSNYNSCAYLEGDAEMANKAHKQKYHKEDLKNSNGEEPR
jgi:hypothetical protein